MPVDPLKVVRKMTDDERNRTHETIFAPTATPAERRAAATHIVLGDDEVELRGMPAKVLTRELTADEKPEVKMPCAVCGRLDHRGVRDHKYEPMTEKAAKAHAARTPRVEGIPEPRTPRFTEAPKRKKPRRTKKKAKRAKPRQIVPREDIERVVASEDPIEALASRVIKLRQQLRAATKSLLEALEALK